MPIRSHSTREACASRSWCKREWWWCGAFDVCLYSRHTKRPLAQRSWWISKFDASTVWSWCSLTTTNAMRNENCKSAPSDLEDASLLFNKRTNRSYKDTNVQEVRVLRVLVLGLLVLQCISWTGSETLPEPPVDSTANTAMLNHTQSRPVESSNTTTNTTTIRTGGGGCP